MQRQKTNAVKRKHSAVLESADDMLQSEKMEEIDETKNKLRKNQRRGNDALVFLLLTL